MDLIIGARSAYLWFSLAAKRGHKNASNSIKITAKSMSAQDVAQADALALACLSSGYKECGQDNLSD